MTDERVDIGAQDRLATLKALAEGVELPVGSAKPLNEFQRRGVALIL